MSTTRLNKHIALVLGLSRRQADDLIAAGDVVVDGEVAVLGARLQPGSLVTVQGAPLPEQVTYNRGHSLLFIAFYQQNYMLLSPSVGLMPIARACFCSATTATLPTA